MKRLAVYKHNRVIAYALVDDEDYDRLRSHKWFLDQSGYVVYRRVVAGRRIIVRLHREVMRLGQGDTRQVDHINFRNPRNRLDNRRSNLRVVNGHAENQQNIKGRGSYKGTRPTSEYRGVSWYPRYQKWVAHGRLNGRRTHLGYFADEKEAGQAAAAWRATHMPYSEEARLA